MADQITQLTGITADGKPIYAVPGYPGEWMEVTDQPTDLTKMRSADCILAVAGQRLVELVRLRTLS